MEYWLGILALVVIVAVLLLRTARRDDTRDRAVRLGPADEPGAKADIEAGPIRRGGVTINLGGGSGIGGGGGSAGGGGG